MSNIPTAKNVAAFMKAKIEQRKYLYQEEVVSEIEARFGCEFVYINENGNLAIGREVLFLKNFGKSLQMQSGNAENDVGGNGRNTTGLDLACRNRSTITSYSTGSPGKLAIANGELCV